MKKRILGILTGPVLLAGGAVYALNSQAEDCPLKGTPDRPLVKECPKKDLPDCPYKSTTTSLPDLCKKM